LSDEVTTMTVRTPRIFRTTMTLPEGCYFENIKRRMIFDLNTMSQWSPYEAQVGNNKLWITYCVEDHSWKAWVIGLFLNLQKAIWPNTPRIRKARILNKTFILIKVVEIHCNMRFASFRPSVDKLETSNTRHVKRNNSVPLLAVIQKVTLSAVQRGCWRNKRRTT